MDGAAVTMDTVSRKTRIVRILLYTQIVVAVLMLWSDNLEYQLLSQFQAGAYSSDAVLKVANENDSRQQLVAIAYLLVFVVSVVVIAQWIISANKNARVLGAEGMEFTPGWAVGWYFIPFAHLWKPYQAMREIWKASDPRESWQQNVIPTILPLWWFLWIASIVIGQASFRMSMRAEEIHELIDLSILNQVFDVAEIPLALVFLALVNSVHERQLSTADQIRRTGSVSTQPPI